MTTSAPPPPPFGAPLPVAASPETLALLSRRRSASAQLLGAPGPSREQVMALIGLAARVPDHGKLAPWRFVIIEGAAKAALVDRFRDLAAAQPSPAKAQAALAKLSAPPLSVLVVFSPKPGSIPMWEQEMSAGAVCMNLLIAAQAMGFGANWITDWYAYDDQARAAVGLGEGEQVAGYIHLGAPSEPPLERVRPDLADVVTVLGDVASG